MGSVSDKYLSSIPKTDKDAESVVKKLHIAFHCNQVINESHSDG